MSVVLLHCFTIGSFTMGWHGLFTGLAVLAAVIVAVKLSKEKNLKVEDVYSVALFGIVGGIIGARMFHVIDKWGEIYSHDPWMIVGEPARHPLPAYEFIFDLLIFALLLCLRKRLKKDWMLFLIYAPLYSLGRFLLSFIRGDEAAVLGPLHQAHVVSLIIIAVCVPLLIWIARKPAQQS